MLSVVYLSAPFRDRKTEPAVDSRGRPVCADADPSGVFNFFRDSAKKQLPEPLNALLRCELGLEHKGSAASHAMPSFETSSIPDVVDMYDLEITKTARGSVRNDMHEAVRDALHKAIVDLVKPAGEGQRASKIAAEHVT